MKTWTKATTKDAALRLVIHDANTTSYSAFHATQTHE
jgi:hypothetical protein